MQFRRFIRKVFATKILLSGKFLLFVTLEVTRRIISNLLSSIGCPKKSTFQKYQVLDRYIVHPVPNLQKLSKQYLWPASPFRSLTISTVLMFWKIMDTLENVILQNLNFLKGTFFWDTLYCFKNHHSSGMNADPGLASRLRSLYIMGGNYEVSHSFQTKVNQLTTQQGS